MKVIALNGSKRKKYTHGLIEATAAILATYNIEVEIINLFEYKINECIGCEVCILHDKCVLNDDTQLIMEKLINSDGIIIASPVYMENISGKMKTFIDRTCKWFHRPQVYGKPVLSLVTTKGSGVKKTAMYLNKVALLWGALNGGTITRGMSTINNPVTKKECQKFINCMLSSNYSPSLKELSYFQCQKILAYKTVECDKQYWQQKCWNDKAYFIDCKINPIVKLINTGAYKAVVKSKSKKS
ncbi:MAG: hypothetical protein ATN33_06165 [Epulopiscium sp. Nele67-Bin001]|nr:MAG: hypothetical protein ATN33_06165 [Epulopiscium sp. Nele67-Bin001]